MHFLVYYKEWNARIDLLQPKMWTTKENVVDVVAVSKNTDSGRDKMGHFTLITFFFFKWHLPNKLSFYLFNFSNRTTVMLWNERNKDTQNTWPEGGSIQRRRIYPEFEDLLVNWR